jgi:hypothetical protein
MLPLELSGAPGIRRQSEDTVITVLTGGGAAESIPVPSGARYVFFNSTDDFWADVYQTAVIPVGDLALGKNPVFKPAALHVESEANIGSRNISVIAASNCTIVAEFFK